MRAQLAGAWPPDLAATSVAAIDLTYIFEASPPVRAAAAFLLVALLGGVLVRWRGPFLDRSVSATVDHPLASIGYGVAAHLVIAFSGVYLTSRLGGVRVTGLDAASLGVLFFVVLVAGAAVLGFTVVGGVVAEVWVGDVGWIGPLVGGLGAGGAAIVDPTYGVLLWLAIVSAGIGGPVRRWVHATPADI